MRRITAIILVFLAAMNSPAWAQDPPRPKSAVVTLFEDDAEELLKVLNNPGDGAGQGEPEEKDVFSGRKCIKVTQYQRFQRRVPGWDFAIRGKPKEGEYRYLRFAWKVTDGNCLMLQLHDATDWHIRYVAGANPYGWMSKFVSEKAPNVWTVITIDLFKDFGERTLTGIALTMHTGAGYFDHIYLGRTIEDLDRIDAGGIADKKVLLAPEELERFWKDLAAEDAGKQYRAYWNLVAGGASTVKFLEKRLLATKADPSELKQIRDWLKDLAAEGFATREKATSELKKRLDAAAPLLEAELAASPSIEARRRIETLLIARPTTEGERTQRDKARRVLDEIRARKGGS